MTERFETMAERTFFEYAISANLVKSMSAICTEKGRQKRNGDFHVQLMIDITSLIVSNEFRMDRLDSLSHDHLTI